MKKTLLAFDTGTVTHYERFEPASPEMVKWSWWSIGPGQSARIKTTGVATQVAARRIERLKSLGWREIT